MTTTPQDLVEVALAATSADDCLAIATNEVSANLVGPTTP